MISTILQFLLFLHFFGPSEQACKLNKGQSKLSCEEIKKILDYHNKCRNLVATGKTKLEQAKDMWAFKWDKELADVAQGYANNCVFEHNKNRPKGTGENLAIHYESGAIRSDVQKLTELWYNEIELYDPAAGSNTPGTGHFTQMAWADTKFVGCGIAFYEDPNHPSTPYTTLLVCNYKPPGNFIGEPMYLKYENKRCDRGVQSKIYSGLCAHDQQHAEGKYVPCSGYMIKPKAFFLIGYILYGYYRYKL